MLLINASFTCHAPCRELRLRGEFHTRLRRQPTYSPTAHATLSATLMTDCLRPRAPSHLCLFRRGAAQNTPQKAVVYREHKNGALVSQLSANASLLHSMVVVHASTIKDTFVVTTRLFGLAFVAAGITRDGTCSCTHLEQAPRNKSLTIASFTDKWCYRGLQLS